MSRLKTVLAFLFSLAAFNRLCLAENITNVCSVMLGNTSEWDCCPGFGMIGMPGSHLNTPIRFFKETLERDCVPICEKGCKEGNCIGPNKCDCNLNFGGPTCEKHCPSLTFGLNCEHDCACITNPGCNSNYTFCSCGKEAEQKRDACKQICKCRNTLCPFGYLGQNCDVPCAAGTCGFLCSKSCTCIQERTELCSLESCDCICKPRFYGANCEHHCDGILACHNNSTIDCTCKETPEQLADRMKEENEKMRKVGGYLLLGTVCLLLLKFVMICYLYRARQKVRQAKMDLNFVISYSKQSGRTNLVYQSDARSNGDFPTSNCPISGSTISGSFKGTENPFDNCDELAVIRPAKQNFGA